MIPKGVLESVAAQRRYDLLIEAKEFATCCMGDQACILAGDTVREIDLQRLRDYIQKYYFIFRKTRHE